jgi:RNA polymerase sigma-70 factor (ECF subfamily)
LPDDENRARFAQIILPHLDAAYNLARWLMHQEQDAEDVVQEAILRAFRSFAGFHGADGRPWLLAIVRNTCYTMIERNRSRPQAAPFDEATHVSSTAQASPDESLLRSEQAAAVTRALQELSAEYREIIILREFEDLSYKEIAAVADIPIGTVMSRLARARDELQGCLAAQLKKES